MKRIKVLASVAVIGSMLLAMTGCGDKVNYIEKKEFKKILKNELDMEEDDDFFRYDSGYYDSISAYYEDVNIDARWYDDADDAYDYFEDAYDAVVDAAEDGDIKGDCKYDFKETSGFFTINGKIDGDYDCGGLFFCEDMIISVNADSKRDIEDVNYVLEILGLPTM